MITEEIWGMKERATEVVGVEGENEEAEGELDGEEAEDLSDDEVGVEGVGLKWGCGVLG